MPRPITNYMDNGGLCPDCKSSLKPNGTMSIRHCTPEGEDLYTDVLFELSTADGNHAAISFIDRNGHVNMITACDITRESKRREEERAKERDRRAIREQRRQAKLEQAKEEPALNAPTIIPGLDDEESILEREYQELIEGRGRRDE